MISDYSIQIFKRIDYNYFKPEGSGVLVDYSGVPCIISATHVFENDDEKTTEPDPELYYQTFDGEYIFLGTWQAALSFEMDIKGVKPRHEIIISMIPKSLYSALIGDGKYFYCYSDIYHYPALIDTKVIDGKKCIGCGFPTSYYRGNFYRDIPDWEERIFMSNIEYKDYIYKKNRISSGSHIVVRFIQKRVFDMHKQRYIRFPKPYGMSGGGIWIEHNGKYRLAGIMTYLDSTNSSIICTRIDYKVPELLDDYIKDIKGSKSYGI